jgi:hypothetical protein
MCCFFYYDYFITFIKDNNTVFYHLKTEKKRESYVHIFKPVCILSKNPTSCFIRDVNRVFLTRMLNLSEAIVKQPPLIPAASALKQSNSNRHLYML